MLTDRLKSLKNRLFEVDFHDPGTWHFCDTNLFEVYQDGFAGEPLVVRKAKAVEYISRNLPAYIRAHELIVGNPTYNSVAWGSVLPIYSTAEEREKARLHTLSQASVWGHHPPAWDKIIKAGVVGVRQEIHAAIERELKEYSQNQDKLNEYRAMLICLDGLAEFARRHAEVALKLAWNEKDNLRKKELFEIYEVCAQVPLNPARSLHEALQSYWFTYCIVNSAGEFVPLARGDQFLYPYFEQDLRTHRITRERAIDLVGSFLIKCNERIIIDTKKAENHFDPGLFSHGTVPDESARKTVTGSYEMRGLMWKENEALDSESNYNYGQSGNDWLMNFVVGGLRPDGSDATNELSILLIDLVHRMDLLMPTMAARVHKDSPDEYIEMIARILRYGRGEPMIYNDEAIIPGFVDLGIPIEEARDYSNDGCWENVIPGKSHFTFSHVENLQCIEWIFFRGRSLLNGAMEGLDTGDPLQIKSWEEFYKAYCAQVLGRIAFQCKRRIENFGMSAMIAPDPLMSSITDDCVRKGRDIAQDGARYIFHMVIFTGLSYTIDSLAVMKKLVFEEHSVSMAEMIQALRDNWKGHEKLRAKVLSSVPKFGNDIEYVDELARQATADFARGVEAWNRRQDKILFSCGIGTFENYAALGRPIGASPSGRFAKDALASNYSPVPGVDIQGPTAVIKSITNSDLLKYFGGCPLDLTINSHDFEGEDGINRLKGIIRSFCELGGQILTITSCNVEDLEDAKVHPEQHRSLIVRMGGLSAYFIAMAPLQQDNIIRRFKKGALV